MSKMISLRGKKTIREKDGTLKVIKGTTYSVKTEEEAQEIRIHLMHSKWNWTGIDEFNYTNKAATRFVELFNDN